MKHRSRPPHRRIVTLQVQALSQRATRGRLNIAGRTFPCALGRSGSRALKREGDGGTPIGLWPLVRVLYRRDRIQRPRTSLPVKAIRSNDGWCDASLDLNYNRPVRLPYPASTEQLWRQDAVYDIVVVLDHNTRPRNRGGGSAIFMHLARPDFSPTEGCIALSLSAMRHVLTHATVTTRVYIHTRGSQIKNGPVL